MIQMMVIILKGENKFYIENDGQNVAEITFVPSGNKRLIIDHTFVDPQLRGQRVGEALVEKVVEYAREGNKTIIPLCPFAKRQFDQKKEYVDVLEK
ncbi:GNAT family N-acetyltransferase [Chengkuizengella axinellae]